MALCLCLAGCDYVRGLPACDFFRTLAGRPTSAEIASKKAAIDLLNATKARNERLARIADSLAAVAARERFIVDSLKAEGCLSEPRNTIVWSSDSGTDTLARNYYIMVGAFSVKGNAEKLMKTAAGAGYEPVLIRFSNGLHAVALNGSDRPGEIFSVFNAVRGETFCPKGAWILAK